MKRNKPEERKFAKPVSGLSTIAQQGTLLPKQQENKSAKVPGFKLPLSSQKISLFETHYKNFTKQVQKIDGKIFLIRRIFKDGSGVEYEYKFCSNCGLKYTGAKMKVDNGATFNIVCPNCFKS